MPKCPDCGDIEKITADFYQDASRCTGVSARCKKHHQAYYKQRAHDWYERNRESHIQRVIDARRAKGAGNPE